MAAGFSVDDIRGAPDRSGEEVVFLAGRPGCQTSLIAAGSGQSGRCPKLVI